MNGPSQALFKSKHLLTTFSKFESLFQIHIPTLSLAKTKILHGQTTTSGLHESPISTQSLSKLAISYALCGCVPFAQKLFDELPERSLFLYNAIVRMYVHKGLPYKALKVFVSMVSLGECLPDKYTYPIVIKACSDLVMLDVGVAIHGRVYVGGFHLNIFVMNSLLAMYMNSGEKEKARRVFDEMCERSVVSWNTLISGNFQNGCSKEALMVFNQMIHAGVEPDCATVVSVLPSCGNLKEKKSGRKVHTLIEKRHLGGNIEVCNALVDMYAKCGCMDEAWLLFDQMSQRDVVTWTSIINGYILNGNAECALALCWEMQFDGVRPNSVTLASLLSACASLSALKQGQCLHGWAIRRKLESDVVVETALIDMYAKCNFVQISLRVFSKTSKRRTVPWNAVISGCIHNGLVRKAIEVFKQMIIEEVEMNSATFTSLIPAYATLADLKQVMNLHSFLIRSGFVSRIEVATGIVDIYSKCGSLESAHVIFNGIPKEEKDIILWSVIIAGYGMHGDGKTAVLLFNQMVQSGTKPNEVTFTSVLHACGHAGLVDEGLILFKYMLENCPTSPNPDHYTCIVDLLGRAGRLNEAYDLIRTMPFKHNHSIWGALLGACVIHENVELGEIAAKWLFEHEPENTGNYVLLAKIYAAVGRWKDAEKVRHIMNDIGLRKMPAHSLIEVGMA